VFYISYANNFRGLIPLLILQLLGIKRNEIDIRYMYIHREAEKRNQLIFVRNFLKNQHILIQLSL